jgi:hypothetical protein
MTLPPFPLVVGAAPAIEGCPSFPADNVWNARVDTLPVHANSAAWITTIGAGSRFHMDFGSGLWDGGPIGIPYVVVGGSQPKVPVAFDVADESDPGPYPIPANAPIEGGPAASGDRHVLVVDKDNCILYETYSSYPQGGGTSWTAYSGARFDLRSNALRPGTWTSADAAGLPIFPGLARYDEAAAGTIAHALRFTAPQTQRAFMWPARHFASSSTDAARPPMGARFRLKASVYIDALSPHAKAIAQAMKTYGIILADNGSSWYVSGAPDERWNNDVLHQLDVLRGSDFEAVDATSLMLNPDSGQVAGACLPGDSDTDGIPDCLEAGEGRNPALKDNDIFANTRLFAMQQYRDFLAREGDAAGISFWASQMNAGTQTRAQMVETFFNSAEFQGAIAPVARLYFAYFLRIPDYGGLNYWIGQARAGSSLETISDAFATSAEFVSRYGSLSNSQFVTLVYQNVLGRAPDAAGLAYWAGRLATGLTRGQMMAQFSESAEYAAVIGSEVYVTMIYSGMLRRAPDQAGFDFWVGYLDKGNTGAALINGFLGATEYRQRFLP